MKIIKAISVIALALVLTGCVNAPAPITDYNMGDCDGHDLVEFDSDCGYWDSSGAFVTWWWVTPGVGGVQPYDWHPIIPRGGSTTRPKNARPSVISHQPMPTIVSKKPAPTPKSSVSATVTTKPRKTN